METHNMTTMTRAQTGSFVGHIDEGLFFIFIAVWWMYNGFKDYIQAECDTNNVFTKVSYGTKCCGKSTFPVEIVGKILFPLAGFMGEVFSQGIPLHDSDGNFRKVSNIQHMTIYSIFLIHGVIDLLMWYRVPIIKGSDRLSVVLAFVWYGVSFYFHSMDGRSPLETTVHILPTILMYGAAISILLEIWFEHRGIWPLLTRSYFVFTLGTWFTHVAFVLYVHDRFPGDMNFKCFFFKRHSIPSILLAAIGGEPNLAWDRHDHRNVHFMIAAFGIHLNANLTFMVLFYLAVYVVWRQKGGHKIKSLLSDWKPTRTNGLLKKHHSSEDYKLLTQTEDFDE